MTHRRLPKTPSPKSRPFAKPDLKPELFCYFCRTLTICVKRTCQTPSVIVANTGNVRPSRADFRIFPFSAESLEFQSTAACANDWEHLARLFSGELPADRFDRSSNNRVLVRREILWELSDHTVIASVYAGFASDGDSCSRKR